MFTWAKLNTIKRVNLYPPHSILLFAVSESRRPCFGDHPNCSSLSIPAGLLPSVLRHTHLSSVSRDPPSLEFIRCITIYHPRMCVCSEQACVCVGAWAKLDPKFMDFTLYTFYTHHIQVFFTFFSGFHFTSVGCLPHPALLYQRAPRGP